MKIFSTLLLLFSFLCVVAAEVVFVPGWGSEKFSKSSYESGLQKCFPDSKVSVLTWKSFVTWKKAIVNADNFVPEVVQYISQKSPAEQADVTLVGHSLGARIVAGTAEQLAQKNIKIKQIILLGAAVDFDSDLSSVKKSSCLPAINIFSRNDTVLKYIYSNAAKKFALGFCGSEAGNDKNFIQYDFATSEPAIANTDSLTSICELSNHLCKRYLQELEIVLGGKKAPYKPRYDYSEVFKNRKKTVLSIPENWIIPPLFKMTRIDSYADWVLATSEIKFHKTDKEGNRKEYSLKVYFIFDPYGRIFMWNLLKMPLEKKFAAIRKQIKVLD